MTHTYIPLLNHPILDAYLKMNLIVTLLPTTLIPLGVLMAVYSTMTTAEVSQLQRGGSVAGGLQLVSLTDPLMTTYMNTFGIAQLTAMTLVPFAFLLGRSLFENVVMSYGEPQAQTQAGGGGMMPPWTDIPVLNSFLQIQGTSQLTPATLVPLGILAIVYKIVQQYNNKSGNNNNNNNNNNNKNSNQQQIGGMGGLSFPALQSPALLSYLQMMGISVLTPQTLLPFALILSKNLFETYVTNHSQTVQQVNGNMDDAEVQEIVQSVVALAAKTPRNISATSAAKEIAEQVLKATNGSPRLTANVATELAATTTAVPASTSAIVASVAKMLSRKSSKSSQQHNSQQVQEIVQSVVALAAKTPRNISATSAAKEIAEQVLEATNGSPRLTANVATELAATAVPASTSAKNTAIVASVAKMLSPRQSLRPTRNQSQSRSIVQSVLATVAQIPQNLSAATSAKNIAEEVLEATGASTQLTANVANELASLRFPVGTSAKQVSVVKSVAKMLSSA